MSNSALIKSSLAKKYYMAATGLFLCLFLVGHLLGNLQLLMPFDAEAKDGGAMFVFDQYAKFMTTNPLIKVMSYLTYFSILFHAIDGILLTIQNKKARPVQYAYNKPNENSKPQSRYMAILGSAILIFIIIHMANFWGVMHFGELKTYKVNGEEYKPLYAVVVLFFKSKTLGAIAALLYALAMVVLGFHLSHGFKAAFQSLGLNHPKYNSIIQKTGLAFSVLVPLAFAIIPLYLAFVADFSAETLEMFEKGITK